MGAKPKNLIKAISEGILGYMLYQSRCGIQEAYSEYLLYDPIVRISKDKNTKNKTEDGKPPELLPPADHLNPPDKEKHGKWKPVRRD